jgi:hypothetical protein
MFLSRLSFLLFFLVCGNAIDNGGAEQDPLGCDLVSKIMHLENVPVLSTLPLFRPLGVPLPGVPIPNTRRYAKHGKCPTSLTSIRFVMATRQRYVGVVIESMSTQNDKRQMGGNHSAAIPTPLLVARWKIARFPPAP